MAKKDHSERKKEQRRKQLDQSVETPRGPIKNMFDMQYVENEDEERTDVPPGSNSGSQTGGYHYISPEEPAEGGRDKY